MPALSNIRNPACRANNKGNKGLPGPSTVGVHCRWAPGASGGGWLIDGGQEIDGLNAYIEISAKHRTFGPYFSARTVGRLVAGL